MILYLAILEHITGLQIGARRRVEFKKRGDKWKAKGEIIMHCRQNFITSGFAFFNSRKKGKPQGVGEWSKILHLLARDTLNITGMQIRLTPTIGNTPMKELKVEEQLPDVIASCDTLGKEISRSLARLKRIFKF